MKRLSIVGDVNTGGPPVGGWVTLYSKKLRPDRIRGRLFVDQQLDSEEEDEPQFKIGVPGYRAIFGKGHPLRRLFWILVTLVLFFLSFVQVNDRIQYYMKTPTRVDLVVTNNETLIFPRLTICHRNPFNGTAMEAMRSEAARALAKKEEDIRMPFDLVSVMNLSALWNAIGNNLMAGKQCWFGRGKNCNANGDWRLTHTVRGPCYSYHVPNPVKETGIFNGLYAQMEGTHADAWTYFIHPTNVNPALAFLINGAYEYINTNVDAQIRYYQTTALNVWHNPCVDDVDYTVENCRLECFSEVIALHANCCLPFMRLGSANNCALCNTPDDYYKADEELQRIIGSSTLWNPTSCNCSRPCYATDYETNIEKVVTDMKPARFRMRIFFQDKSYENYTENRVYSLTTLFCDIGSSVGLLLGASVLTIAETLEWGCFRLFRFWRNRRRHHKT